MDLDELGLRRRIELPGGFEVVVLLKVTQRAGEVPGAVVEDGTGAAQGRGPPEGEANAVGTWKVLGEM